MSKCKNCGADVPEGEAYCGKCGTKVEVLFCPYCGARNEAGGHYCISCGKDMMEPEAKPETETAKEPISEVAAGSEPQTAAQAAEGPAPETDTVEEMTAEAEAEPPSEPAAESEAEPPAAASDDEEPAAAFVFCPGCGAKNGAEDRFCLNCGTDLQSEVPVKPSKTKGKLKMAVLGAAGVVVIAIAAVVGVNLAGGGSEKTKIQYFKDNAIYQYDLKKKDIMEISDRTVSNVTNADRYFDVVMAVDMTSYSSDGRYIFYMEKYSYTGGTGDLYYKDLKKQSKKKDTSEKIDSDVSSFRVTDDGKVIYAKERGDTTIYIHNLKDKDKIASDVQDYYLSEDGKKLIWQTSDGLLYTRDLAKKDGDKEKLDSDVTSVTAASEDLRCVYYMKEDALYIMKDLSDKDKIDSDVVNVNAIEDTNHIYYLKKGETTLDLSSFITDDMASADAAMTEPDSEDYQKAEDWYGYTYYSTDYDKYYDALEAYQDKVDRDYIRESIDEEELTLDVNSLYFYNGTESLKVQDDVMDWRTSYDGFDVMCIKKSGGDVGKTYKLSEIDSLYTVETEITNAIEKAATYQLVVEEKAQDLPVEAKDLNSMYDFTIDGESKILYYVEDTQEDGGGTLKSVKYTKESMESPSKIDTEVYDVARAKGSKVYYEKDYDDTSGEYSLYVNQEKIGDDVGRCVLKEDTLYYFTDLNDDGVGGTLFRYDGKDSTKISDDVTLMKPLEGGEILLLKDFSMRRMKGDLYLWKNEKKSDRIDEDVVYIKGALGLDTTMY